MSASYEVELDDDMGASVCVEFKTQRRNVADYSVVLLLKEGDESAIVRVYDGAHGVNELHRYTQAAGKQPAEVFHSGTLGEGMRAAIKQVRHGYVPIIEAWRAK